MGCELRKQLESESKQSLIVMTDQAELDELKKESDT